MDSNSSNTDKASVATLQSSCSDSIERLEKVIYNALPDDMPNVDAVRIARDVAYALREILK